VTPDDKVVGIFNGVWEWNDTGAGSGWQQLDTNTPYVMAVAK
jgi:hypothetical protein